MNCYSACAIVLALSASCAAPNGRAPEPLPLEVPTYAADDPRPNSGGFVREVRLVDVERGGTKYTLMAFRVGDVLTLGAMTEGPFVGEVEWQLGAHRLRFEVATEPRSGRVLVAVEPVQAAQLHGDKAGFGAYSWTNIELPAPDWWPDGGRSLQLTFEPATGDAVRLPADGAYAAQFVAR